MSKPETHVPIEQFGYLGINSDMSRDEIDTLLLLYFYTKQKAQEIKTPKPLKGSEPTELGEIMEENGKTYVAVQKEKTKELFWYIKL